MKSQTKTAIQFLLVATIVFSFFPLQKNVSASDTPKTNIPIDFQIVESNDEMMELYLSAPSYQIENLEIEGVIFDKVEVPGAINSSEAGKYQLPIASTLIGVPLYAEITLTVIEDNSQQFPGNFKLAQAPLPARIDDLNSTERWEYSETITENEVNRLYSKNVDNVVQIAEEAWIRDQRVVRIEYKPFQFDAQSGVLTWHPNVKVQIEFNNPFDIASDSPIENQYGDDSPFEAMLETSLLNYEQSKDWRGIPSSTGIQTVPPDISNRYRISITEDGIYQLTYDDLYATNPSVAGFDLSRIQMSSQGEDIAIHINDGGDGYFGPGDTIFFYGQRFYGDQLADLYQSENTWWRTFVRQQPDGTYSLWKPKFNALMLEKYTRENVYWLFEGTSNGLRMQTVDGNPSGNNNDPVPHYRKTVRAEESNWWKSTLFAGEETWFWENVSSGKHPFSVIISAPADTGDTAILRSEFVSSTDGHTTEGHYTKIYLNDMPVHLDDFHWWGKSRYLYEHNSLTPDTIDEGINTFYIEFLTPDPAEYRPNMFFDWFEIEYNRLFVAEDNAIAFTSAITGTQKYQVSGFTNLSNPVVLDISNPNEPGWILNSNPQSGTLTISLAHLDPISVAMDNDTPTLPQNQISFYEPPNWTTMNPGFDYVFITHKDLAPATETLANYRSGTGLSTVVIDINDLYNEFNFGIYHPIAIKNFLAYAFANWDINPTYALLVGDGHWNFYDSNLTEYGSGPQFMPPHLVWVDPWQGEVDSANLLATIIGEDAFPDLMIARLPVNSQAEIDAYRVKLENYETSPTPEVWEQNHVFVADLADDAGDFPALADEIITQYIDPNPNLTNSRIYERDYGCINTPTPTPCPEVNTAITNTLNISGTLILNYIGHASVRRWSHEKIFTPDDFPNLTNNDQLPIILSMDCLDGYWSSPADFAGSAMIEEIIRQSNSGAIGAFSPTGLGVSTGHDMLHKGFYDAMMNEGIWGLGAAAQHAKGWLFATGQNQDLLHTFTVFGDPALEIRNPYGSSVSPLTSSEQTEIPGTILTHEITIENTGAVSDTYDIQISYSTSDNWTITLPITQTQLSPGQQQSITIEFETPTDETSSTLIADFTVIPRGNIGDSVEIQLNNYLRNGIIEIFLPLLVKGN